MTDSPYGVTPGGAWPPPGPPAGPPPAWRPPAPKQSRALVIISLTIGLIAIAVAIGSWFRPSPHPALPTDPTPRYSDQQIADAKTAVCAVRDKAFNALKGSGGQHSDDPMSAFIITVNTRLAIHVSSDDLTQALHDNPATPPELTTLIGNLASVYERMVLAQLAGAPSSELDSLNSDLDSADTKAVEACK
jgi:hypothetical protein